MSFPLDFKSSSHLVQMGYEGDPRRHKSSEAVSSPLKHSPVSTSTVTPNPDAPLTPHSGQAIDFKTISPMSHPATPAPFFDDHNIQVPHHHGFSTFEELSDLQLSGANHDDFASATSIEGRSFWDQSKRESSHTWPFSPLAAHVSGDYNYYGPPHSAVTLPSQNGDLVRPTATQLSPNFQPTDRRSGFRDEPGSGYWSDAMRSPSNAKDSVSPNDIQQWPDEARFPESMLGMNDRLSLPHFSVEGVDRSQSGRDELSDDNGLPFHDSVQKLNMIETDNGTDSDYAPSKPGKSDKKRTGKSNNGHGGTKNRGAGRNGTPSGSNISPAQSSSNKVSKSRRASSQGRTQASPRQANNYPLNSPLRQETVLMSPSQLQLRPFTCPLSPYGCQKTFTSKNEWKRHISSQHICLGFWRCDLCTESTAPNDFNRKDLFTQHVRRMHVGNKCGDKRDSTTKRDNNPKYRAHHAHCPKKNNTSRGRDIRDDDYQSQAQVDLIETMHVRCWKQVREHPTVLACYFCPPSSTIDALATRGKGDDNEPGDTFQGPGHYEAWMEHVASHLAASASQTRNFTSEEMCAPKENPNVIAAAAQSHFDASTAVFTRDTMLRSWLIREGVIEVNLQNSHGSLLEGHDESDRSPGGGDDDVVDSGSAAGIRYTLIDRGVASDRAYQRKVSGSGTRVDTLSTAAVSLQARQLKYKPRQSEIGGRGPHINAPATHDSRAEVHSSDESDQDADGDVDMM
ncbi:MAG: hypothetical protein M1831_002864 [Alyxoria varia]|nr:MAG: hypothetical protein M1831_002864 [Alyxoria varia]